MVLMQKTAILSKFRDQAASKVACRRLREIRSLILRIGSFKKKEAIHCLSLTLNQDMTRWGMDGEAEVFYTSKDKRTLAYSVTVSLHMNAVSGFSKDIMALLSYIRA